MIPWVPAGNGASDSMITRKIGEGGRWLLEKIVDLVASTGINPNLLTFFWPSGELLGGTLFFAIGKFRSREPW